MKNPTASGDRIHAPSHGPALGRRPGAHRVVMSAARALATLATSTASQEYPSVAPGASPEQRLAGAPLKHSPVRDITTKRGANNRVQGEYRLMGKQSDVGQSAQDIVDSAAR